MHFDLNDLRLFVLAADEGSLTKAAAKHHLSLAAASARIKALEAQTDLPLLYREARGVRVSPPGQAFLHHARLMLHQAELLRSDLHEYGGGLRGRLRIYANTTAVTDFLPEILPRFLSDNPKINIDLQEKPNAEIAKAVLDGRGDIGIVSAPMNVLGLQSTYFSTDRLVLATSRKHRLAKRKRISFAEILDEDAVGMHPDSTLQTFLSQVTERLGKPQKLRIQLASFDAMCRMIGAGVGVGIVPESAAKRNQVSMNLALIELTEPWSVRERYILTREQAILPSYAQALIEQLCAHYASNDAPHAVPRKNGAQARGAIKA